MINKYSPIGCGIVRRRNWEDRYPILASLILAVLGGVTLFLAMFV